MDANTIQSLAELGSRFAAARKANGLTQAELGQEVGLDRTAITRIEAGQRGVDALELARIASALRRPIDWFLIAPPPAVVSRRAQRDSDGEGQADVELERLARDAELLIELAVLLPREPVRLPFQVETVDDAERAAAFVRDSVHLADDPATDLLGVTDTLGLYVASVALPDERFDGAYVALDRGGVALVNGAMPSGRRRFTVAHELGHHILADAYSPEWILGDSPQERERLINAFAIHFLMPRCALLALWRAIGGAEDARRAALTLGARFGVSWTAVGNQLTNLGLIDERQRRALLEQPPVKADYLELALRVVDDLPPPSLSPLFSAGVVRAFRGYKLSRERALEILRATFTVEDLPVAGDVPLAAMTAERVPFRSSEC